MPAIVARPNSRWTRSHELEHAIEVELPLLLAKNSSLRVAALALAHVLALDPEGLYRTVRARRISMCGVIPTTVALVAALELGAREAELVRYGNSGEVSGVQERVVGYAGPAGSLALQCCCMN